MKKKEVKKKKKMKSDKKIAIMVTAIMVVSVFAVFAVPVSADGEQYLVKIDIDDEEELAELGSVEIVEQHAGYVIARCTKEQILELKEFDPEIVGNAEQPAPVGAGAGAGGIGVMAVEGPDAGGYYLIDSISGVPFNWIDITATGTEITGPFSYDDAWLGPYTIGFPFTYYGNIYNVSDVYVGSNGYVSFDTGYWDIPWDILPNTDDPNNEIMLFGDDMYFHEDVTDVYYEHQNPGAPNERFVIEFVDVTYCCGLNVNHTFEVILYPNGDIKAQYLSLEGTSTKIVGIENIDGTVGLGYIHGLSDGLAILYTTRDGDTDGMADAWEDIWGFNSTDPTDAGGDLDGDGLTNLLEFLNGADPTNPDTDGDGLSDFDEVNLYGTDPTNADTDGGGINDGVEVARGTDPLNPWDDYPWSMFFAETYEMEYSQYDTSTDDEIWVSIVYEDQTVTHVQLTDTTDWEDDPSIAVAPNGNIVVVWEYYDGDYEQIYCTILDNAGNVINADIPITSSADHSNYDPCVAITPDQRIFVVWEVSVPGDDPVGYVILDVNGNVLTPETWMFGNDDIDDPTVAASTKNPRDNKVVIAWEEDDGSDDQVWYTIMDSNGNVLKPNTQVTISTDDSDEINAAILPNGNFALTWEESVPGPDWVGYTILRESGIPVVGVSYIVRPEDIDAPGVAATPGGNIVIVWDEWIPDMYDDDVFYTILGGAGNIVKPVTAVTTYYDDDDDADVAVDPQGNIVIAWEQWDPDMVSFAVLNRDGTVINTDLPLTDPAYDIDLDGGEGRRQIATRPTVHKQVPALTPIGIAALVGLLAIIATSTILRKMKKR